MLVDGSAVGGVDSVSIPVDPLDQPVVAGSSDGVQARREATLTKRHQTHDIRFKVSSSNDLKLFL